LRACLLEGSLIGPDKVGNLAKLPSRNDLLSTLLATLKAPMGNLAALLGANMQNVVGVLNALKDKKE
jgi:large subunit ribosomal protein L10